MDREARDYWRQQRRKNARRGPLIGGPLGDLPGTTVVLALMVVGYIIFLVPSASMAILSLPAPGRDLVSSIYPGGFLGLVINGFFVYVIGMQAEHLLEPWQYVLSFILSGAFGAFSAGLFGPAFLATMGPLGLLGIISHAMWRNPMVAHNRALTFVGFLLALNFVLSGFSLPLLLGMVGAYLAGVVLTAAFSRS